jgi:hypothetical protein
MKKHIFLQKAPNAQNLNLIPNLFYKRKRKQTQSKALNLHIIIIIFVRAQSTQIHMNN